MSAVKTLSVKELEEVEHAAYTATFFTYVHRLTLVEQIMPTGSVT